MADSRPGGIEKIAHLFIAGHGASALRARDNSPRNWTSPAAPSAGGNGQSTPGVPPVVPIQQPAGDSPNDRAAGPEATVEPSSDLLAEAPDAADVPAPAPKAEVSPELQSLLARARVVAVLSGHMGPLAGPAAEAVAKGLARQNARVAMLYGPAEFACLHHFASGPAGEALAAAGEPAASAGGNGHESAAQDHPVRRRRNAPKSCDMLLLPDWVFQFDLWPAGRPVASIALAYGAGSDGLMAAYGALKGLIARFGRPDEVLILPFGCNEQEETWGQERLVEMCRRFLEITPKTLGDAQPELRVHASPLQPIGGGVDGVKQLLESIGKVRLAVVRRDRDESPDSQEPAPKPESVDTSSVAESPAADAANEAVPEADPRDVCQADEPLDVTVLVPVSRVPADGRDILQALLEYCHHDARDFFDIWQRGGVAGTILDGEGYIGVVGSSQDLLGFALWLCRQGQAGDLAGITIAVREPDEWLIEAAEAMPVPVTWLTWRVFELEARFGVSFEEE